MPQLDSTVSTADGRADSVRTYAGGLGSEVRAVGVLQHVFQISGLEIVDGIRCEAKLFGDT